MSHAKTIFKLMSLTLVLASCSTLQNSAEFDQQNLNPNKATRAPAAYEPPRILTDDQKIDPMFLQTQADYNYSLGEAFSMEGSHQKAVEHFKTTLIYDTKSNSVKLRLATEYLRAGQVSEALEIAQQVVSDDPKNTTARMLLAGLFSSMKLYPKALEQYEEVIKYNPENIEAALYTGAIYAETGKSEKALKYFNQLLAKVEEEQVPTIHYYMARVYVEQKGKQSQAQTEFHLKKALSLRPSFTEALLTLGALYTSTNQGAKASQLYEDYQKKNGPSVRLAEILAQMYLEKEDYDSAYEQLEILESQGEDPLNTKLKMALILVEKKVYDRAIAKLREILKEVPDSDRARFYLAAVYEQTKQSEKAVSEYKRVPSESSYYNDAIVHAVYLLKNAKNFEAATNVIKEAVQKKEDEPSFYSLYASLLSDTKKNTEAAKLLEVAVTKFPKNTQIQFFLGTIYDSLGQKEKVVSTMKSVLEKEPNHVQALNYIAYTYAEQDKNLTEAETYARKAVGLEPNDGYILDTLGWVLFKQGRLSESLKYLEAAYKIAPDVAVIAEHLGDVYVKQAMIEKAKRMYKVALEKETEQEKAAMIQSKISALEPSYNRIPASTPVGP